MAVRAHDQSHVEIIVDEWSLSWHLAGQANVVEPLSLANVPKPASIRCTGSEATATWECALCPIRRGPRQGL
jgi:hypothetical protein